MSVELRVRARVHACGVYRVYVRVRPHVAINDNVCASEYVQIVGCMYFKGTLIP